MKAEHKLEMEDLLHIHFCALSDLVLVFGHQIAARKYDDCAETIQVIRRKTDVVAGFVGNLLVATPTTEQMKEAKP